MSISDYNMFQDETVSIFFLRTFKAIIFTV